MNFMLTLSLAAVLAGPAPTSKPTSFSVGITTSAESARLRVAIDKWDKKRVSVRITQADGTTLLEEFVGRHELTYRRVVNLEELPAGAYYLLISSGSQIIRRLLTIERVEPVVVSATRRVSLQE